MTNKFELNERSLRKRAEELLSAKSKNFHDLSKNDVQSLFHELQVHQVELEMQNEELRRAQLELEESRSKYADLYDFAPVGYFTLSENGIIEEANLANANLLGTERKYLITRPFSHFVHKEHQDLFYSYRKQLLESNTKQNCELRIIRNDGTAFYTQLEGIAIRHENGGLRHLRIAMVDVTQRKQAEERFQLVVESVPNGIVVANQKGEITFVNSQTERIFGYSRKELIGQSVDILVPERFRSKHPEYRKDFHSDPQARLMGAGRDLFALRKDGSEFPVEIGLTPIQTEEGIIVLSAIVDITQRKQAEESLRNSEERYRALYENNPLMCFTVDTEGKILSANQFGTEQLGYTAEELVGQSVLNVFYEEDKIAVIEQLTMCLQNPRRIAHWELRKIRKDGTMLWVKEAARTMRDINDNTVVLIVCEDISERKLAEETLRESEERFRIVADNAPVMLWMSGPDKLCNYVNKGWLELKGRSIEEELGNGWTEDIHPDDVEYCLNTYLTAFDARQEFKVVYRLKRHDGEYRWILGHGVPRFTGDNAFIGYIGCCEDITDRKLVMELQQERLRFETLLSEISAGFLHLAPNDLDRGLEQSLKDLVEFLGFDRSSIALFSEDMKKLYVTHSYAKPGFDPFPKVDLASGFPWYTDKLRKGETVVYSNLPEGLPSEAAAEREYCIKGSFKSHLAIPLKVENSILGGIGFGSFCANISWPKEYIQRLKIIGEIFASALVRKQSFETILHRDNLLQTIFSSLSSHVVVLDREGTIVYMSKSWEQFAKGFQDQIGRMSVGCNYLDIYREAIEENGYPDQETLSGIQSVLEGKLPAFTFEFPFRAPTGEYWYLINVDRMPDESGGVVISHFDITARKASETALIKALSEIKQLKNQLQAENIYLREEIKLESSYDEIVGASRAIKSVLSQAEQVANTGATVLLFGETGTGKELIARAIHRLSPRKGRAMIKINCAALPSTLIEAELFGREKGAYTGALTKQMGRFEIANGSTIFLDEISELSLDLQSKLLRVLQEGEFERLGSSQTIKVDVRVIAATNRDLSKAMEEGKFREDLYYRLNVFPIHIPPLRERREDIPMLVWAFVKEFSEKMGRRIEKIPRKTMEALQLYPWPGNVRELRNVIERAMILTKDSTLQVDLPKNGHTKSYQNMTLEDMERKHILEVMETTNWRIRGSGGASEILGLKPSTLESKMIKLGIQRKK